MNIYHEGSPVGGLHNDHQGDEEEEGEDVRHRKLVADPTDAVLRIKERKGGGGVNIV